MTPSENRSDALARRTTDFILRVARIRYPRLVQFNVATVNMFNYIEVHFGKQAKVLKNIGSVDKHGFSPSNDGAYDQPQNDRDMSRATPTNRNSAAVAGDDADARRLLARVQGMLGLAQKDTSSGIFFDSSYRVLSSDIEASNLVADSVWTANTVDVLAKFSGGTLH
ncbi:hypothetical protein C8R48DRAFT_759745 [Suillus tomentosus]|nr:hypothetical protein C8R48DRAFT_759745 [Suillus tomentosus]